MNDVVDPISIYTFIGTTVAILLLIWCIYAFLRKPLKCNFAIPPDGYLVSLYDVFQTDMKVQNRSSKISRVGNIEIVGGVGLGAHTELVEIKDVILNAPLQCPVDLYPGDMRIYRAIYKTIRIGRVDKVRYCVDEITTGKRHKSKKFRIQIMHRRPSEPPPIHPPQSPQ